MKKIILLALTLMMCFFNPIFAQKDKKSEETTIDTSVLKILAKAASLKYQESGEVKLANGKGVLNVPSGYKFLDAEQTKFVLSELWGNPPREADGMLFPSKSTPLDSAAWAFVITYDEDGHISDEDADKIDYAEMLTQLKTDTEEGSKQRVTAGYGSVKLINWASTPYYDKNQKTLHWAKELEFDSNPEHTLNYDVRVLGRQGVISLNAVGTMGNIEEVKGSIAGILSAVKFSEGNTYSDFNPSMDKVAAVGIGGLVAGKVLAKAGIFAILLKYIKVIAIAVFGGFGWLWNKIKGKKEEE